MLYGQQGEVKLYNHIIGFFFFFVKLTPCGPTWYSFLLFFCCSCIKCGYLLYACTRSTLGTSTKHSLAGHGGETWVCSTGSVTKGENKEGKIPADSWAIVCTAWASCLVTAAHGSQVPLCRWMLLQRLGNRWQKKSRRWWWKRIIFKSFYLIQVRLTRTIYNLPDLENGRYICCKFCPLTCSL